MTKLPIVTYGTLEKLLINIGFAIVRQKGSHVFFRHSDGRYTTVPCHPCRVLARPLIREILREIEITPEQFKRILEKM
ncbi:type II toxin-antitoxin system HicA family toxin [bacterium]|nr:type II toxin-antitoxin system HicA family toxin [bacterium]